MGEEELLNKVLMGEDRCKRAELRRRSARAMQESATEAEAEMVRAQAQAFSHLSPFLFITPMFPRLP